MNFYYQNQELYWQHSDLKKITSSIEQHLQEEYQYQGAYYLYHADVLHKRLEYLTANLPDCEFYFSVKSLSNINILKTIISHSHFGVDVVSGGEIQRALRANIPPEKIVFAGVGKTEQEIEQALNISIKSFHAESLSELQKIAQVAKRLNKLAHIALRVNPNIAADTHHYIATGKEENKFGIPKYEIDEALKIIKNNTISLQLVGLQAHVGSQIKDTHSHIEALQFLQELATSIEKDFPLQYISLGGGFGVDYELAENSSSSNSNNQDIPQAIPNEFNLKQFSLELKEQLDKNKNRKIVFEPGRFISAYAGILVSHVIYIKEKTNFKIAVVDAAMNDLMRPALYQAEHPILPLYKKETKAIYDIVGPVCESGDFFRKKISLYQLQEKETLFILHSGAYGSAMASRYNSRMLLPEVLLDEKLPNGFRIIRKPENWDAILNNEIFDVSS